jgi:predicted nucleic acid-binding protein
LTELGFTGGVVYDALHLQAAEKAGAKTLVTFNRRDFDRLAAGTSVELTFL